MFSKIFLSLLSNSGLIRSSSKAGAKIDTISFRSKYFFDLFFEKFFFNKMILNFNSLGSINLSNPVRCLFNEHPIFYRKGLQR